MTAADGTRLDPRLTALFDAGATWATEPTDRRGYGDALRDAVERATTPGDDRGREAQVEQYPGEDRDRLFFLLCDVIGTELRRHDYAWNAGTCACGGRTDDDTAEDEHPAVEVASAVTEGLQKRRADVLRALAAPAETEAEAGRPDRMTPRDELVGQYRAVSDVLDDYLMREHGRVTSHNGWDLYLDLLAEQGYEVRALAASPPAPEGEAEDRIGLDLYGVAGVLDAHADDEAEQARAAHLRYLARAARSHADHAATPPARSEGQGATEGGDGPAFTVGQSWFREVLAAAQHTVDVSLAPDDIVALVASLEKRRVRAVREGDAIARSHEREAAKAIAWRQIVRDVAARVGVDILPVGGSTAAQIEVVGMQLLDALAEPAPAEGNR